MKKLILVVEDDKNNSTLMGWILEDAGFDAVMVETAEEGLIELEKRKFDLVLMDINLGAGMDGKEATAKIRTNPRTTNIPVIAVTATARVSYESIYASGVDDIIEKPIDENFFIESMRALLDSTLS